MKKVVWLLIIIFLQACTAQKKITARKGYNGLEYTKKGITINTNKRLDVIVANIKNGSMFSFLFSSNNLSDSHFFNLSPQATGLMDLKFKSTKQFTFFNGGRTMEIECECEMRQNYYLKNVNIKEGKYKLTYNRRTKVKGEQIKVSDRMQNLLFKNIRATGHTNPENIYFKDLEFTVLDLSDTLNVKLLKQ